MATLQKAELDAMMLAIYTTMPKHPDLIVIDPKPHAMMRAAVEFEGRDHRRIKREMNKAWRAKRKEELARGVQRTPAQHQPPAFQFWRQRPETDQGSAL
jgi:hypothetical protein